MNLIKKLFYYERFQYKIEKPIDVVQAHIEKELERGVFSYQQNIAGSFTSEHTFKASPIFGTQISNFERGNSFLKGTLQEQRGKTTLINIDIRPNSVYGILFLFSLFGSVLAIITIPFKGLEQLYVGLFFLIVSFILFKMAIRVRGSIKKNFEKIINPLSSFPEY